MSNLMKPQLEVIRERMQRATPGPWAWFGNTKFQSVYLATQHWGRHFVMQFDRWGMQGAQPTFYRRDDPAAIKERRFSRETDEPASKIPVYEVAPTAVDKTDPRVYREDIVGLRNADAAFIAHSRADVEWLVGEVDRLQGLLDAGTAAAAAEGNALKLVGWRCEHSWRDDADVHMGWNHKKGRLVKESNVSGSSYPFWGYGGGDSERRCPAAVPMFIIVTEPEAVPA